MKTKKDILDKIDKEIIITDNTIEEMTRREPKMKFIDLTLQTLDKFELKGYIKGINFVKNLLEKQ